MATTTTTFTNFDPKQWAATVKELDEVLTEWEKAVQSADEEKLKKECVDDRAHRGA